jgi:hypothetical protein
MSISYSELVYFDCGFGELLIPGIGIKISLNRVNISFSLRQFNCLIDILFANLRFKSACKKLDLYTTIIPEDIYSWTMLYKLGELAPLGVSGDSSSRDLKLFLCLSSA